MIKGNGEGTPQLKIEKSGGRNKRGSRDNQSKGDKRGGREKLIETKQGQLKIEFKKSN